MHIPVTTNLSKSFVKKSFFPSEEKIFVRNMTVLTESYPRRRPPTLVPGHPLDTIKVRLQTQSSTNPEFTGMADCFRKTWAREGLGGLYAGAASPLLGAMAHNAGVFFSYGMAKRVRW